MKIFTNKLKPLVLYTLLSVILFSLIFFSQNIYDVYLYYTFNISYLFQEPLSQLQKYFPSYFWLVFLLTRIIKYLLPLFFIYLLFYFRSKMVLLLKHLKIEKCCFWWKNVLCFFLINLGLALLFYTLFFYGNFAKQLMLAKLFLSVQILYCFLNLITNYRSTINDFKSFLFAPILPYNISITRVLFFSYLILIYIQSSQDIPGTIQGLEKGTLPYLTWLINIIPVNSDLYTWMCYLGVLCCFFIVIGYKTRFFLLFNTLIVFYVIATPNFFGKLWHEQIVIWIAWIMAFSSCFDALSIDSYLSINTRVQKSGDYSFHLKIIWLHFGLIYFFAGFYKLWLCGFDWALSQSMINQVHLEWFENYNKIPGIRIDHFPNLLKIAGFFVILFELSYLSLLFSKKTRWISVVGGLLMHNSVGYFMYISFLALLQAFYIVFIPWNKLLTKLKIVAQNIEENKKISLKKWSIIFPVFILCMNFLYGVFRIDSYPFSVYPVYAAIVPETFKCFKYRILDKEYEHLNIHHLGKEHNFGWESYSRFEPEIISNFENTNELDTSRIKQQWLRWQNGIPILQNIDSIEVWSVEVYIDPEKMRDTISKYKILDYIKLDTK